MQPLSIALVYDDSLDRHGGIPQYLAMLSGGLSRLGHRVSLLVGSSSIASLGEASVYSLARNVPVRFNGSSGTMPLLSRGRDISAVLGDRRFDVVHVQVPYSPFLASRVVHRLPSSTALVGTFHVNSERPIPRLGARLLSLSQTRSLRRFDRMMCVSQVAASFARRWFGLDDSVVVPNMVDRSTLRWMAESAQHSSHQFPQLLFIGNLVPRKGIDTLLNAMPAIVGTYPEARLTVAGDGYLRARLERTISRAGLERFVRFVGAVSEAEKAILIGGADVACFPSLYGESFGIVLLEAMAVGRGVVVAARNEAYAEVLRETPEVLSAPRDERDLAETILRLLGDRDLYVRTRARQQTIVDRHDVGVITRAVLAEYECALRLRWRLGAAELRGRRRSRDLSPLRRPTRAEAPLSGVADVDAAMGRCEPRH